MNVRLVVAITDDDWFENLRMQPDVTEVNFWAPSATNFRALVPGELFLFKLRAPRNAIVGGGVFAHATTMPLSLAWEAFGKANGTSSLNEMRERIARLRRVEPNDNSDFEIGCRVLTQPFFYDQQEWIPAPQDWAPNIVSFKTYFTRDPEGLKLWNAVQERDVNQEETSGEEEDQARFAQPRLICPRLGQGAFRFQITDIYQRCCAVTGVQALPALEAAHIRPYSDGGLHEPKNGLLLRRDIHSLFDAGYMTVTTDYRFKVSRLIREEFDDCSDYYAFDGIEIFLPEEENIRPEPDFLLWHNNNRFKG